MTLEGLCGRRKMTALVQRTTPETSPRSVDWAMKTLGLHSIRRSKESEPRSQPRTASQPLICSTGISPADAPNRTWVMSPTSAPGTGFVYTAFILDVFGLEDRRLQRGPTKADELVDVPLRMALWQRGR